MPPRRDTEMGAFGILAFVLVLVLLSVIAYYAWRWYDRQRPPEVVRPDTTGTLPSGTAPATATPPDSHVFGGLPRPTGGQKILVLENKGYVSGYSEERRNPLYVGYRVFQGTLPVGKRPPFVADVRTSSRVASEDYREPIYDQGHMAPNSIIARCYGQEAQEETFLMTNICPQTQDLNQRVWLALERLEADIYPKRFDTVWVLAGPIFGGNPSTIGSHRVQVPDAFYKILVEYKSGTPRTMAVIMPQNVTAADSRNLSKFLVKVRDIEARTALDFFPDLPKEEQDRIEANLGSMW